MRLHSLSCLAAVFAAACGPATAVDCPAGSQPVGSECRVTCAAPADCLSTEHCDLEARVCLPGAASTDAGPRDAGPPRDAEPAFDAGFLDATATDAQSPDGGFEDAAAPDATPPRDTGPRDADPIDAGFADADPIDTGTRDAAPIDAGFPDAQPPDTGPADGGAYGAAVMRNAGVDLVELLPGAMPRHLRSIPTSASSGRPTWSPAADRVAFQTTVIDQNGNTDPQVEIYTTTGVFIEAIAARAPDWSNDTGGSRLAAANLAGTAVVIHPLIAGPLAASLAEMEPDLIRWAPNGTLRIAFTVAGTIGRDLYVRDVPPSNTRFRVSRDMYAYAWSPNGARMAVVEDTLAACRVSDVRIGATGVTSSGTWLNGAPCDLTLAWSPDGLEVAIAHREAGGAWRIAILGAGTPGPLPLGTLPGIASGLADVAELEWTPDSRYVAASELTGPGMFQIRLIPARDAALPGAMLGPEVGPGRFELRPVN